MGEHRNSVGGGGGRICGGMERWSLVNLIVASVVIVLLGNSQSADAAAVMSVDLGSEWMKIGIVSPGVPLEVVLNKESKRKTPVAISFRDGERLIGEDALSVAVKFPAKAYLYFLDLLGKKLDNPIVQLFQKRFPYYKLVADEERGTVVFQHDEETFYSPEELLAMILNKCREYAQDFARQPVKEAVFTVPPYFNQAERRSVLAAAELAGIKVLQLMNTNTAAALNYGIFRRKDFEDSAQNILLYDMGASSTVATIVNYQVVTTKEKGMMVSEKNPQLTVLGVGYDRTLGGLEMTLRLRDALAKAFNDMKKTKTDVFTNPRSMAKLFKEAGRVKTVLSANADHYAQVEGLLEEIDFRTQMSRDQLEQLNEDLFERVKGPVEQALNAAAITMDVIDQVILVGAGTRVPKVQEKLAAYVQRELGKSLNTDEAAALGAVYRGADLSSGFKVKKFITKDGVLFPILVDFEREVDNEDGTKTLKIVRRTLFSTMNPYPQKKILTFNKHISDFNFYVSYGELPYSKEEVAAIGSTNITKIDLSGVAAALEKNAGQSESKGVKAHFNMDDSGILAINLVESVFEKNTTDTDDGDGSVKDTLSKLGSAFTKLFSGSAEGDGTGEKPEDGDSVVNATADDGSQQQDEQQQAQNTTQTGNETEASGDSGAASNATTTPKKMKAVLVKEPLDMTVSMLDIPPLEGEKLKSTLARLKQLDDVDKKRAMRDRARNNLETFVIDMQNKVYANEYEKASTEEERNKITQVCSEISDWLYEDGSQAAKEEYDDKFKSLKLLTKDLEDRVREHKDRPDAMDALDKMLNISMGFLESSKSLSESEQVFTEVELTTLEKLVQETFTWRLKKLGEQEKTPLNVAPVLTVRQIAEKIDSLDREVKYMVNKARVNKLNKQRQADKDKANAESEANKTGDTPTNESAQGEQEVNSEENTVDTGKTQDKKESQGEAESNAGASAENPEEKVSPSPSEQDTKEGSHTEL